ncbi:MAG: 30S ribosome-binding factor RbfA [Algisphaera sp.]
MSHDRKLQVESLLQRTVAQVLQRGLADPRIKGLVSVTRLEASVDLKTANVFVSIIPEEHEALTMHGLKDAARFIQAKVKQKVALRVVPHLRFVVDESIKKQEAVLLAIQEGMERTGAREQDPTVDTDSSSALSVEPTSKSVPESESDSASSAAESEHPET